MVGVVALALVLALVSAAGWYLHRIDRAVGSIPRSTGLLPTASSVAVNGTPMARPKDPARNSAAAHAPMTFVLMGTDSRGGEQGRSDTLMVAYLPGDRQHAYLVSFPRDMWVPIPGHGTAKINAAYAYGGAPLAVATLEQLTQVRMQHAAVIDFEGFIKLTDVLGGVTVYNPHASASRGYTFPQGTITLRGEQALVYVRERYDLPNGDLDRAARQRAVVTAIIDKILTAGTLGNPNKFSATVDAVAACMTVDAGLTNEVIRTTATSIGFTSGSAVRSIQAPISGFGTSADGQSIDIVDHARLAELARAMQTDTMETYFLKYNS